MTDFKPPLLLRNRHLQTMWGYCFRKALNLLGYRERVHLPDGDYLDIDWMNISEQPIAIVMHGLGGSINSHYANGIVNRLVNNKFGIVFMTARGFSQEANCQPRLSHAGFTDDLAHIVSLVKQRYPNNPLFVLGYSISANVLLKWLGEKKISNYITAAIAVSAPYDLALSADYINKGSSKIYQKALVKTLKRVLKKLDDAIQLPIDISYKKIKTIRDFDNYVIAPLHGFSDADDYYQQSSSIGYLKDIKTATLILHAKDDPFIPATAIPSSEQLSNAIELYVSDKGGHVGFVTRDIQRSICYWGEEEIMKFINNHLV